MKHISDQGKLFEILLEIINAQQLCRSQELTSAMFCFSLLPQSEIILKCH